MFSQRRSSPHFTNIEGSIPCSQQPAICPLSVPDESIPCPPILPTEGPFNIIIHSIRLGLSMVSSQVSVPKACVYLSSDPFALHVPPTIQFRVRSPELYLITSTNHMASLYGTSTTLLAPPSQPQISSSPPYSPTPSSYVLVSCSDVK